uniref:RNA-directed DNA polymerase n=1 Tax=Mycena chlorophos TaxID=658473 RepID=A0ABQ0M9V1_MYCCL|nr:TY3B-TY3B protein [Mycena chlorophos]
MSYTPGTPRGSRSPANRLGRSARSPAPSDAESHRSHQSRHSRRSSSPDQMSGRRPTASRAASVASSPDDPFDTMDPLNPHLPLDLDELEVLRDSIPIWHLDPAQRVAPFDCHLPSSRPFRKISNKRDVVARRDKALSLGSAVIGKEYLLMAEGLTKSEVRDVFPNEMKLLRQTLVEVERIYLPSQLCYGYRLKDTVYRALLFVLNELRTAANDTFTRVFRRLPELPNWGKNEDISEFLYLNDFEILAVCLEVEVEGFLKEINRFYDPIAGQQRDSGDPEFSSLVAQHQRNRQPASSHGSSTRFALRPDSSIGFNNAQVQSTPPPAPSPDPRPRDPPPPRQRRGPSTSGRRRESSPHDEAQAPSRSRKPRTRMLNPVIPKRESVQPQLHADQNRDRARSHPLPPSQAFGFTGSTRPSGRRTAPAPSAPVRESPAQRHNQGDPDSSDSDSSSDGEQGPPRGPPNNLPSRPPARDPPPPGRRNGNGPAETRRLQNDELYEHGVNPREEHFDLKLKSESIPRFDGNVDNIVRWMLKVNNIARRSVTAHRQLGSMVPQRLEGDTESWYWSLPGEYRDEIEENWDTLRAAFRKYFMNRKWLERQRSRANKSRYREPGYERETPSMYYIRKMELLTLVYDSLDDQAMIIEIMEGVPSTWNTILTTQNYDTLVQFQDAIRYHEDALIDLEKPEPSTQRRNYYQSNAPRTARVNLVGWSANLPPPAFPPDDKNVSKRGTPEEKGARPCRHCGSGKHWDNDCNHGWNNRTARTHLATASPDELQAIDDYEDLYYSLVPGNEASASGQSGFEEPLQITEPLITPVDSNEGKPVDSSALKGEQESSDSPRDSAHPAPATAPDIDPSPALDETSAAKSFSVKYALNARSRKRLARDVNAKSYRIVLTPYADPGDSVLELQKHMARPPGSSFLGAAATETTATVNGLNKNPIKVIVDSGSDITLISRKALNELTDPLKIKTGHDVNLIQVTGKASLTGFVNLDLFFYSEKGPVKLNLDAYVVNGMSTPFLLGNDFADQYSISILRDEGQTHLKFGDSDRTVRVQSLTASSLLDDEGHTFKVSIIPPPTERARAKSSVHRRHQVLGHRQRASRRIGEVSVCERIVIPPESSAAIRIRAHFPKGQDSLFVERQIRTNGNERDLYGAADSLISRENPVLHVANFSDKPVVIGRGQVLGRSRSPRAWLDRWEKYSAEQQQGIYTHANLLRSMVEERLQEDERRKQAEMPITSESDSSHGAITSAFRSTTTISSKAHRNASEPDDPLAQEPLEGGPKTAEPPADTVPTERLLKEVDFSPHITVEQRKQLEEVVLKHSQAFGLDGRLGNYPIEVDIPMKPGAEPVSLPPFPVSPVNREVIDQQMDSWIQLGVIEPSKSPWAAPVFIVYRNSKPRMVIDLRRLNEMVVPDEFPLPRQDDILQALSGAQWLSTLDALAGFTQLTVSAKAAEKLAFRTHKGLWQFRCMPFGYRNGPSVFQWVMQNVLAPFLWIFALVYIDDIVVYSLTFEDHVRHLDQVFGAIAAANITLSPAKCHLGYQSLLLLGQKVSRLGLSTHKEKVDAILDLAEPKNVQELQSFLGMMVYFSAYIPFYAWIAQPFFHLLKKGVPWDWTPLHQESFELCKQVLTNAPVRGYAIPGRPYRVYTDACDYGLAGILQQVQPVRVRDLRGTRIYERLERAFAAGESVPCLVTAIKGFDDIPATSSWASTFDDTTVHIERVVSYWSRVLKSPERNYSPTEREALALKEALIKFQPFLEGENVAGITDHAALTWSRTFQNVNCRLLTWGTVFSAYPGLRIVHRAGRVHSNVDPISRLRRRVPFQDSPTSDPTPAIDLTEDPLKDMYGREESDTIDTAVSKPLGPTLDADSITAHEYHTSRSYNVLVGISDDERKAWTDGYQEDPHFSEVLHEWKTESDWSNPRWPQYHLSDSGLIYFEDWEGNNRLCVPAPLRNSLMAEIHDTLTEAAHAGYHRTYNRLASNYYWPKMARDLKRYTSTCDICQKAKPRRHAPVGLLQPIPIPSQPFEVVSMDFIPELPVSNGFDNVLVIVDKLTKYAIFVPCSTSITELEAAQLFFKHVISRFGISRQVITDRDTRWRNSFWAEICRLMGMKRALTTAYHPQADGQTEIMNQTLEIALRAYVNDLRDNWSDFLDPLALSYNTTPHSVTQFPPSFLLHGFHPITGSSIIAHPDSVPHSDSVDPRGGSDPVIIHEKAQLMIDEFEANRSRAKQAILLSQVFQKREYNDGRLQREFEEGDKVLLNPHSLKLLRDEKGRGKKLLMKFDGPFEISRKLSPITYQLRLPISYGIHPIINIAHLEPYAESPEDLRTERPTKSLRRDDFDTLPEVEIERIIAERLYKVKGRRVRKYKVRWQGFGPEHDEWLTARRLRNAPKILESWLDSTQSPAADTRSKRRR